MSDISLAPTDPARIGNYVIARRIGSGGQGTVYEAYDPEGRRVAVKVLHPNGVRRPPAKEVAASRRVASFSTARIVDVDLDGDPPYLVSEFVDGPSLRTVVEEAGPYTGDALHRLAIGIATAVAAIHEAGVVHRDLKPDNVLLGPDGPRVIDFGIARVLEASSTTDSGLVGTPAYMAPELFTGDTTPRPAADVYAWGAVVLFAGTGRMPFQRDNVAATVHQILTAEPDLSALPESLRPLVARAMSKDPDQRPDARELLLALVAGRSSDEAAADAAALRPPERLARRRPELGQVAEAAYEGLDAAERAIVPRVLLRLIGPEAEPRTVEEAELRDGADGDDTAVEAVLAALAEHGLIIREGGEVRLAGPALVRAWPRLREWIEADRPGLAVHHRIREAARAWDTGGRNDGELLTGTALNAALEWAATARTHLALNSLERRFLTASAALAGRRRRTRRVMVGALAVLLAVSVSLGGFAEMMRRTAEAQRAEADARRDVAVAGVTAAEADRLRQADPATAMKLSVAAWRVAPSEDTRSALLASVAQPELAVFSPPTVDATAYSADGGTQAVLSGEDIEIWDIATETRRTVLPVGERDEHSELELSRDGRFLIIRPPEGESELWDTATGKRLPTSAEPKDFTAGGRYLRDGAGRTLRLPELTPVGAASDAALDAVVKGGYVHVRRAGPGGTPVARFGLGRGGKPRSFLNTGDPVVSDDGAWVAVPGHTDGIVLRSLDGRGRHRNAELPEWAGVSRDGINVVAFSRDGRALATATEWAVQLWDTETLTMFHQFSYPGFMPVALAFRDDGALVVGGFDGTVRTLDVRALAGPRLLRTSAGAENGDIAGALFSPDGRTLATVTKNAIRLWDRTTLRQIGRDVEGDWNVEWVSMNPTWVVVPPLAFSADGRTLAAARSATVVSLIDVATTRERATFVIKNGTSYQPNEVLALAFSPDGRTLAVAESNLTVRLWDTRTLRPTATVRGHLVTTLVWSPDGRTLALGGPNETRLWRVGESAEPGRPLAREHSSEALLFSKDGRRLVVRGENECACATLVGPEVDARVWVWDTEQGRPVDPPLAGHTEPAWAAAFSPDGNVLATVSADGTLRLWDAATHRPIGLPVETHRHGVAALAFDPGGTTLTTVGTDSSVHVLDLDPAAMIRTVCTRAGGGLSPEEWRRYIPDLPYRETCGGEAGRTDRAATVLDVSHRYEPGRLREE